MNTSAASRFTRERRLSQDLTYLYHGMRAVDKHNYFTIKVDQTITDVLDTKKCPNLVRLKQRVIVRSLDVDAEGLVAFGEGFDEIHGCCFWMPRGSISLNMQMRTRNTRVT